MASKVAVRTEPVKTVNVGYRYEELDLSLIERNPDQPRQDFSEEYIKQIAESIKRRSLLHNIVVREHPEVSGGFVIVAGENRFRALELLGVKREMFKILTGDVAQSFILSAIENLHRRNLNPIEEAQCYKRLREEFGMTWEEVRDELGGANVATMLNKMKLLDLPLEIQKMVREGTLPQVSALNLAQHKTDAGEYCRMAHDLVAGKTPVNLHFREQSSRSEVHIKARLPRSPEDFSVRLVRLFGSAQSMPTVIEAFLALPSEEQDETFTNIHPSVLGKLKIRATALARAAQAFAERAGVAKSPRQPKKTDKETPGWVPTEHDKQPPSLSEKVLRVIFYADGREKVNLSRKRLDGLFKDHDVDILVANALESARFRWGDKPRGSEEEQSLSRFLIRFRREYGKGIGTLKNALERAKFDDESTDPVDIGVTLEE